MRKADVVLAALAVAALVATGVGVARSDDWTAERTVHFAEGTAPLQAMGPNATAAAPARYSWAAPANATGARLQVAIDFAGQAVQGGNAIVTVRGIAPTGAALTPATFTLAIPQGATAAHGDFAYNTTWLDVPGPERDTRDPEARMWTRPLALEVIVERPSDVPVAQYAFTAGVAGVFTVYAAA